LIHQTRPYVEPPIDLVTYRPWELRVGETWVILGDAIEGWDAETSVQIRRVVSADWPSLRQHAGLPLDFPITVSGSWTSSTSGMKATFCTSLAPRALADLYIGGTLDGSFVGGVLELRTAVTLTADWAAPPGVACRAGSLFSEHRSRLILEGSGSLFPVTVVDFSHTAFDPDAGWHLAGTPELNAPFFGAFLLSLNARDSELLDALTSANPTPAQRILREETQQQIAQQLIDMAVDACSDDLLSTNWPPDSVGDVLKRLLIGLGDQPSSLDSDGRRSWLAGAARRLGYGRVLR
jgi:hypothetical protein